MLSDRIRLGTEGLVMTESAPEQTGPCQGRPLPEPTPSRKPAPTCSQVGQVGLRAGRHLPLAGAGMRYHFLGQGTGDLSEGLV